MRSASRRLNERIKPFCQQVALEISKAWNSWRTHPVVRPKLPFNCSGAVQLVSTSHMLLYLSRSHDEFRSWLLFSTLAEQLRMSRLEDNKQSTSRKRKCSPVFTAPHKTLGVLVMLMPTPGRKCGHMVTEAGNVLFVASQRVYSLSFHTRLIKMKKITAFSQRLVVLIFW